jgi:hypothetical protein
LGLFANSCGENLATTHRVGGAPASGIGEQQIVWVFSRPTAVGKDSQHLEHYGCDKKYSDNDGINNKRKIGIPQRFHERSTSAAIQIFMPVRFSTPH